jgi:hypothetical protein
MPGLDLQFDQPMDGRWLRVLNIVDEIERCRSAWRVAMRREAAVVIDTIEELHKHDFQ